MKLSDFKYDVPEKLIAQYPAEKRDESKLMILDRASEEISHARFKNILDHLNPGDALVINETKVFPARLIGFKEKTNAKVEVLLLRQLEETMWEVLVKPARKVRIGNRLMIADSIGCDVIDNTISGGRVVKFDDNGKNFFDLVEEIGASPLPPYTLRAKPNRLIKNGIRQSMQKKPELSQHLPPACILPMKSSIRQKQKGWRLSRSYYMSVSEPFVRCRWKI